MTVIRNVYERYSQVRNFSKNLSNQILLSHIALFIGFAIAANEQADAFDQLDQAEIEKIYGTTSSIRVCKTLLKRFGSDLRKLAEGSQSEEWIDIAKRIRDTDLWEKEVHMD